MLDVVVLFGKSPGGNDVAGGAIGAVVVVVHVGTGLVTVIVVWVAYWLVVCVRWWMVGVIV